MPRFLSAHASHPDANLAMALVAAQIEAQRARLTPALAPTLGFAYFTDALAAQADALWVGLQQRWPGTHWVGTVGVGVIGGGVEYFNEPGLTLMVSDLPADGFQVFNGRSPMGQVAADASASAHTALVHADPSTHDLTELLGELAARTRSGYLFGGLAASRGRCVHLADGMFEGGLSGVAFGPALRLVSRVTQGCQPLGPSRRITRSERNLVLTLDDQPALPLLLTELGLTLDPPQPALRALRNTLVGLTDGDDATRRPGSARSDHSGRQFGDATRVRHLMGLDPARQGIAIADNASVGQQLAFCRRDEVAARRDLRRICAEIRDELEGDDPATSAASPPRSARPRIAGAIYVSCSGRGGPHFGAPSAEAQIVQHALGDVPLVGFFAAGEIAHHQLYGYTGVLTVFAAD